VALGKLVTYFNDQAILDITKREYQQFINDNGQQFAKTTNRKMNSFIRTCVKEPIDKRLVKTDFTRKVTVTSFASKNSAEKFL